MSVLVGVGVGFEAEHPELQTVSEKAYNTFEYIEPNHLFEKFCIDNLGRVYFRNLNTQHIRMCSFCKFDFLFSIWFFCHQEAEEIPFGSPYFVNRFVRNKHQKVTRQTIFIMSHFARCLQNFWN